MDNSRTGPEVQAFSLPWTAPGGVLGGIVAETGDRVAALLPREEALMAASERASPRPSFARALAGDRVAVIAEVKRRSPSKGEINSSLSIGPHVEAYAAGGAAALSILTEPTHFGGSADDLQEAARVSVLPLLKKDFHVHPLQIAEAKVLGASAVLLIVRAIAPSYLPLMIEFAARLGLDALVEVRTQEELDRAMYAGARLLGVNARNLETLEVSPELAERVIRSIPASCLAV